MNPTMMELLKRRTRNDESREASARIQRERESQRNEEVDGMDKAMHAAWTNLLSGRMIG